MLNSLKKILFWAVAVLSLAVTSACVPDGTAARGPQSYSAAASTQPPAEFLLGSGDRVRINVFGADQISGEYQVDLSGGLAVPLAGTIPAIGITPKELGDRIAAQPRGQPRIDNTHVTGVVISTQLF